MCSLVYFVVVGKKCYTIMLLCNIFIYNFLSLFFITESHSVPQKVLWWKRSSMKHQLPFQSIRNALLAIITHITRYPYTKTETIHTTNQMTLLQMPQPVQALTIAGSRKCSKKSEYNKYVWEFCRYKDIFYELRFIVVCFHKMPCLIYAIWLNNITSTQADNLCTIVQCILFTWLVNICLILIFHDLLCIFFFWIAFDYKGIFHHSLRHEFRWDINILWKFHACVWCNKEY